MQTETFTHDGKEYILEVIPVELGWKAEILYQNRIVHGENVSSTQHIQDYAIQTGHPAIAYVFDSLKEAIQRGDINNKTAP